MAALMIQRPDKLRAQLHAARLAWEELPTGPDWYGMRARAEARDMATVTAPREDADKLAACWNALAGLSLSQVERLGKWLEPYNADEVEDMLREGGV